MANRSQEGPSVEVILRSAFRAKAVDVNEHLQQVAVSLVHLLSHSGETFRLGSFTW
jgi:hypothetical protein